MNILKKLVLKDLKLNKKRTVGTIVGIILSCALIMVVGGMFYTLRNSLLQNAINQNGYYHIRINRTNEEDIKELKINRNFSNVVSIYNIGNTYYNEEKTYSGDIYSLDKKTFDDLSYKIIEGEFPKDDSELLINRSYQYQFDLKVGDYIDIEIGEPDSKNNYMGTLKNTVSKKVKVSGIINRYGDLITTGVKSDTYVTFITLKNPSNYKKTVCEFFGVYDIDFLDVNEKYGTNVRLNQDVLWWEVFDFSDDTISFLYGVLAVVIAIIMITSIFSIRNSFAISTTEKLKTYGMLSSVGATRKQILKMVLFEGFVVGLIGIVFGVLLGLFVTIGLSSLINFIAENAKLFGDGFKLYYDFSFLPIIISIVTSVIVIFLSVIMSAIRASHTSPIKNIRNADDIKGTKLKVPSFISKLFGIGGTLSYKNLKRSKKKYRVTIVSLTVSILVFITASSLVEYGIKTVKEEYGDLNYNLEVYGIGEVYDSKNGAVNNNIERLKKVEQLENAYSKYGAIDNYGSWIVKDKSKISFKLRDEYFSIRINLYSDSSFKDYVEKISGDYNYLKDKFIVLNRGVYQDELGNKRYAKLSDYQKGDLITLVNYDDNSKEKNTLIVGGVTDITPIGINEVQAGYYLELVGDLDYFKEEGYDIYSDGIFFQSDDPYQLEKDIKELDDKIHVQNLDEQYNQMNTVILIISIIVYGFIIVITLIGVTSVFNTINSNMELRSKDFATLKSIGMTKKEFNNMINLEAIFYSFKSLIYGIILGLIGSYIAYYAFIENYNFNYILPIKTIIISIVFIVLLVIVLMRYSIKKINKQNIIETIRNNNI